MKERGALPYTGRKRIREYAGCVEGRKRPGRNVKTGR